MKAKATTETAASRLNITAVIDVFIISEILLQLSLCHWYSITITQRLTIFAIASSQSYQFLQQTTTKQTQLTNQPQQQCQPINKQPQQWQLNASKQGQTELTHTAFAQTLIKFSNTYIFILPSFIQNLHLLSPVLHLSHSLLFRVHARLRASII